MFLSVLRSLKSESSTALIDSSNMKRWKTQLRALWEKAALRRQEKAVTESAHEAISDSEVKLKLAMEAACVGYWEIDLATGRVILSANTEQMFGLAPGCVTTLGEIMALVHPDDRERIQSQMHGSSEALGGDLLEFRILRPDGTVRWIAIRGQALLGPARVLGIALDTTDRKRSEERLQNTLEEVRRLKESTEAENVYLRQEVSEVHRFGEIVGSSNAISQVLKQAEQVALTDTTVLIMGETGTGKELLARAVHARSRRNDRPLVKLNCASLPASLVESELFGHEKGAFTGATSKRVGRFELADKGTIFLDEIGELSLDLQSKLLRVLQEGEFERVGSSRTIKVNVRVIAATNRDLHRAMREKLVREDLYFRLNVYPIHMPPLRQRKEDIALLARTFLNETGRRLGRSFSGVPQRVIEALQQYDWPGNIRELQNVIERAAVISNGPTLELPERWAFLSRRTSMLDYAVSEDSTLAQAQEQDVGIVTLKQLERNYIIRVLQRTHWRIEGVQGAASLLGLNPSTLRSRMLRLGIQRSEKTLA
jgi:PAS domain S-box-containing protein